MIAVNPQNNRRKFAVNILALFEAIYTPSGINKTGETNIIPYWV
ncbi:hypothetical protein [Arachidicoccus sp.]